MSTNISETPRAPWYKKWWVWAIAAVLVLAGLGGQRPDRSEQAATETTESTQAQETDLTPSSATSETSQMSSAPSTTTTSESPRASKPTTVKAGGQEWQCQPVPNEVMGRILDGDRAGRRATVVASQMVQGADNLFVSARLQWDGEADTFDAVFTAPIDGAGPITSASSGTATLFNWPETPGGPLDGTEASEECLKKAL
ncbi:hypothetical protein [Corynebacterium qintianiae]|uniref:hypothetical protein n=1 Tax=Corynebacterium qintianiae TaxID=2709392 RepID=UPI0013EA02B5|nr:hypothetical protein [Corynebacterium qintianiae]